MAGNSGRVAEQLVDGAESQGSKNLRRRTQKEVAGTCGNEQDRAAALSAGGDEDDTLAFIIQVKEEVERCLEAGMSKKEMFRELREKGSPPAATFAVYKELRHQNKDFFKEYYLKMDLKKQAGRLKLLLHQYRTVRAGGADTRPRGTATKQTTTAAPDDVELPKNSDVLVGLHGNRQPPPSRNYCRR